MPQSPNPPSWRHSDLDDIPVRPNAWTGARWGLVIGIFFLMEAASLLHLSRWPEADSWPTARQPRFQLYPPLILTEPSHPGSSGSDPTYLALPSSGSFARALASSNSPPEEPSIDFHESPAWLASSAEIRQPPIPVPAASRIRLAPPQLRTERRAPRLLPEGSWVEVRRPGRTLAEALSPPEWKTSEVLRPTVVEVAVNAAGAVISARLVESNGLPAADEEALAEARLARFQAVEPHSSSEEDWTSIAGWEQLTFHWHTRPNSP